MAKRKPKDIGELPPAMFDLKSVSTPVGSVSEASIDVSGYDPAWDDPNFCQTKPPPPPPENPVLETLSQSDNFEESPASELVAIEVVEMVDVVEADPPISDELSYDEQQDRLHLERKVERAFYEAGKALRELRDRRLYRSTHKTFESYCRDRFGFSRRHPYRLIDAAEVVENLIQLSPSGTQTEETQVCPNGAQMETGDLSVEMCPNGTQTESREMCPNGTQTESREMCPIGSQILPTSERQIRHLTKLDPDRQRQVWQKAVEEAGGKVPSGRIVKDIVEQMQQVESPSKKPARAHHLTLQPGGLVEVTCPDREKIHARLGRIAAVREKTVEVWLRDRDSMAMNKHVLKHHQVEAVPLEREPEAKDMADRIAALRERQLDPFELRMLELLEQAVVLTPVEMGYLEVIEGRVGGD